MSPSLCHPDGRRWPRPSLRAQALPPHSPAEAACPPRPPASAHGPRCCRHRRRRHGLQHRPSARKHRASPGHSRPCAHGCTAAPTCSRRGQPDGRRACHAPVGPPRTRRGRPATPARAGSRTGWRRPGAARVSHRLSSSRCASTSPARARCSTRVCRASFSGTSGSTAVVPAYGRRASSQARSPVLVTPPHSTGGAPRARRAPSRRTRPRPTRRPRTGTWAPAWAARPCARPAPRPRPRPRRPRRARTGGW